MTITLIDLSSIAHPLYHTTTGDPNPNATAEQTVAAVHRLAHGNPHVAVCCDSGRSWRKDISSDYKANRPERDESLIYQITLAQDALRADGFPVWSAPGFEADDLIATGVRLALDAGHDAVVCTADKDLLQLVGDQVAAKNTRTGNVLDAAGVVAKLGVRPDQVRDYLSLTGDASDNVKGCVGVGDKTAVKLLTEHQTLDAILGHLDDGTFTGALLKNLRDFAPRAEEVRTLIGLRYDAPIPFDEVVRERTAKPMEESEPMSTDEMPLYPGMAEPTIPAVVELATVPKPAVVPQFVTGELMPFERGLEPRNLPEAKMLSEIVHTSGQFRASFGNPQSVMACVLAGRELGLQAMASLRAIHIVEGKPTLSADLIRALVLRSGLAKYFRCTERTHDRATFETQRGDDPAMSLTFTLAEAHEAGLVKPKSGWEKAPADMLVARASAKLARLVYPDVVHGLYTPDELEAA